MEKDNRFRNLNRIKEIEFVEFDDIEESDEFNENIEAEEIDRFEKMSSKEVADAIGDLEETSDIKESEKQEEIVVKNKPVSKKMKSDKKKISRGKTALRIIIGIILILVISLVSSFFLIRELGRKKLTVSSEVPENLNMASEELTEEEKNTWKAGWIKYNEHIYEYNSDIMSFLIMGIDKDGEVVEVAEGTDGGQADALFLVVVNPHANSINLISINRNTMTDIDVYNSDGAYMDTVTAQITVQHGFGDGMNESCEYQKHAVEKLFYNIPISGYAAINMDAVKDINDSVGGVNVVVLDDIDYFDVHLKTGEEIRLDGEQAYWYVRGRNENEFASADRRLERQKQYLSGLASATKQAMKNNISVVSDLYQEISSHMVTNITLDEVVYLAPLLLKYDFGSENFYSLAGETVMGERFEEFYVDENKLYEMILDIFYEEVDQNGN